MSAATLLGLTAMMYTQGVDAYIYMIAFFVGWPIILFLMAERLRNLGKFTFADITSYRLDQGKVRTMAAVSSLTVVCFYLVAQMVGAGQLIKLLFGLDYVYALFVVGALMMVYVTFGGMVATTWVQIIKACMLLIVGTNPAFFEGGVLGGKVIGGGNMIAMHLAKAVGGNLLRGFLSAVAFATILAVVAGLALAGASAISHDIYSRVIMKGKASETTELKVSKFATIGLGIVAVLLGIAFEKMNIAFMVALAFGVAASANFPVLILSMYWKGLTTRGALWGGYSGLVSAVMFVVLSKSVWVDVLGNASAIFPYTQPALFSMPIAFLLTIIVSKLDMSARAKREIDAFDDQYVRAQTGVGAATASSH